MIKRNPRGQRLDIFSFAKESLTTQIAGIGLIIMAAGGFASYMDHIKASNAMVNMCIRPLQVIKAPYLILALGYICAQLLHVAISSAAGLAMLLLVTFFPVLVRLGVSKASCSRDDRSVRIYGSRACGWYCESGGQACWHGKRYLLRSLPDAGGGGGDVGRCCSDLLHREVFRQKGWLHIRRAKRRASRRRGPQGTRYLRVVTGPACSTGAGL